MHTEPFEMTSYELRKEHVELHIGQAKGGKERHDALADEMIRRGMHHNTEWAGAEDVNENTNSL